MLVLGLVLGAVYQSLIELISDLTLILDLIHVSNISISYRVNF